MRCFSAWLQANFRNGRVEEFLLDQAINAEDMQSGPIAFCVATAMAHFHFSPLILSRNGVAPRAILWDRMRAWARAVQQHYSVSELRALGLHNVLHAVRCSSHLLHTGKTPDCEARKPTAAYPKCANIRQIQGVCRASPAGRLSLPILLQASVPVLESASGIY